MPYKTLVAKYCGTRALALAEIWTILNNMGWTLHDNRDANSYRIYSSNSEDSSRIPQFIRIDWNTADRIGFIGYYFWNNTNQTGLGAGNGGNKVDVLFTSESGFHLWVYGNKNLVFILTKVGTTYYHNLFGFIPKSLWTVESNLTEAATSGTNKTLTLQSTTGFVAGRQYQLIGATAEGRDILTVSSITNSTQLIVSNLPRNYGIGSKLGEAPSRFIGHSIASATSDILYPTCHFNAVGTTNSSDPYLHSRDLGLVNSLMMPYLDPDLRGGTFLKVPINFVESSSISFIGYCDEYFFYTPTTGLAVEDTFGVEQQDTGTATSGSSNTLNDTNKNWGTNTYQGKVVIIATGLGSGHIRKIASNTQTQLTIEGDSWSIDSTSGYRIVNAAYRYMTRNTTMPFLCREGV